MKSFMIIAAALSLASATPPALDKRSNPKGLDVSGWQGNVNWAQVKANGASFAIIKASATENTDYINAYFAQQYNGAYNVGLIRGAYHFAHPGETSGAAQANYFLAHGGGWSADGKTLPGMLDLEAGSTGTCWGLSPSQMVSWIHDFVNTYHAKTSRYPMIYTGRYWWNQCTGSSTAFGSTCPLVLADWSSTRGALPAGWAYESFWQYADSGTFPGDQDLWNGDAAGLGRMALGH